LKLHSNSRLPDEIQSEIDDFYYSPIKLTADGARSHRGGSPRKQECELLASVVLTLRPQTTVDWGLGDGAVSIAISLAKRHAALGRHISIDPFQTSVGNGVGLLQLESRGLTSDVEFLELRSDEFLVQARQIGRCFDFIFVDGDHSLGGKLTDAYLADQVLKAGGTIAFHDGLFRSTAAAVSYLVSGHSYRVLNACVEAPWIAAARAIKHSPRLGLWYAKNVIPKLGYSIVCLQKPRCG
jgi:predicted O-methyltransferase YrrM